MARNKYQTHVEPRLIEVEGWARDGLIDKQIAHNLGVAYSTFREYVKKYSALSAALKRGKEVVDREVENALLKRALGYRYDEVTRELAEIKNPETDKYEKVLIETKRVTKEVQPETAAAIFWLKNRRPDKWRDKQEVQHSGSVNNPMEGLTTEELKKLIESG
ncbi:transposase [Bacillus sp. Gen3]|nr:transposase [Bacillus sp. Gen3]